MPRLLLIEDDRSLAALVSEYLQSHDFEVHIESRGDRAEARMRALMPDIVVLDIGLPGKDGLTVCRELRRWYGGPLLILTARGDETDEIVGLELGADDYVAKPVRPRVLLARVRSLLRRHTSAAPPERVTVGELQIDPQCRSVTIAGREVALSSAEFDLLWVLADNAGKVMSRDALMEAVRGIGYDGQDRSIDLRISRLRKKLGDSTRKPLLIKSVRGVGYLLTARA